VGLALDVTDAASVERFARRALDAFGRVDVLVGNAAADPPIGPLAKIDLAAFGPAMEANVRSNLALVNALAPGMAERRDGAFVFTGSILGQRGNEALGLYGITKTALEGLVRNLAVEWGRHGIRVNAIAPGFVRTDFSRVFWSNPEIEKRVVERTPLGRIAEADDVAGLALLLGAPAGAFISGQVIGVDGGASAW
jgi:dehydrogenase/reductase SDR family protein 4